MAVTLRSSYEQLHAQTQYVSIRAHGGDAAQPTSVDSYNKEFGLNPRSWR